MVALKRDEMPVRFSSPGRNVMSALITDPDRYKMKANYSRSPSQLTPKYRYGKDNLISVVALSLKSRVALKMDENPLKNYVQIIASQKKKK